MQKILSASEIAILDQTHLSKKGFSNHAFMEFVAQRFVDWFQGQGYSHEVKVLVCVGAGNNGGDGFAIARILFSLGYRVLVATFFSPEAKLSPDCQQNLTLLPAPLQLLSSDTLSLAKEEGILIDAYLGLGCVGPLREEAIQRIELINSFGGTIISLDLPSGMPADSILSGIGVKADLTVTLGFPKLALLLPEHAECTGKLVVLDIGFSEEEKNDFSSSTYFLEENDMLSLHRRFHRFTHKGDYGKVLLVAGSKGKIGAGILAAKAAFRTGSGLVTCLIPEEERSALMALVPEAMCIFDEDQDFSAYDAIGIGPGLGLDQGKLLKKILSASSKPIVLDADALNCLAIDRTIWDLIPQGSILTPHLKEFERLFGPSQNHLERLAKAKAICLRYAVILVIKGANTLCSFADGRQVFNSSGTKYMATAGMGDVLTGVITSFLGQGYSPENAVLCGVFHHGMAGELAGEKYLRGTMAQDLIETIPETYRHIGLD